MDILKFKGYEGSAELDMERHVCRGKILFIDDLVTYEADNPKDLQKEFEAAVDDYLETCHAIGRTPQVALKGQFNVRIKPTLHKEAALMAAKEGVSLNEVVVRALDSYLHATLEVNPSMLPGTSHSQENLFISAIKASSITLGDMATVSSQEESFKPLISTSQAAQWETRTNVHH